MADTLAYILLGIYLLALLYITVFCLMQFQLLWYYGQKRAEGWDVSPYRQEDAAEAILPFVTVQLPVYNEVYVVERLIDSICGLEYPRERLEIQVLDDSDDQTSELAAARVRYYVQKGFDIKHIIRPTREGYKAGALSYGLKQARGEFIAIFDADFLPRKDFLLKTVSQFEDPRVGVVQTRWEHINEEYSVITRLQALQLNVHFTVEQSGRQAAGLFLQFNGTAGVWRKQAIVDAGGWHIDTLTEDLDLSYRAQLKGWEVRYLEEVGAPAELPAEMTGLKSQQFRWMKGGAETARKILPRLWRAHVSLKKKLHGTLHLLASAIFVFVFLVGVLSVPVLFVIDTLQINPSIFSIFLTGLLSIAIVYYVANTYTHASSGRSAGASLLRFSLYFPAFLALSMGLSLHNTVAVVQGVLGRQSAFIRTPKFNIRTAKDSFRKGLYKKARRISWVTVGEGILALYFLCAMIFGVLEGQTAFLFFHLLLMTGFAGIFYYSIRHTG